MNMSMNLGYTTRIIFLVMAGTLEPVLNPVVGTTVSTNSAKETPP